MKIVMIRHFQTPGNRKKCYIGRTDEPLLEQEGLKAFAAKRRESLGKLADTAHVIASPMKRCVQTAGLLFPGRKPVLCELMRECDFGIFEGKNYEELKTVPAYQEWLQSGGTLPFPGGEDHEAFKERSVRGFEEMVGQLLIDGCTEAAMVVHGGTIMAVLSRFDKEARGFYDFQVENGGGYCISLDEDRWAQGRKECMEMKRL